MWLSNSTKKIWNLERTVRDWEAFQRVSIWSVPYPSRIGFFIGFDRNIVCFFFQNSFCSTFYSIYTCTVYITLNLLYVIIWTFKSSILIATNLQWAFQKNWIALYKSRITVLENHLKFRQKRNTCLLIGWLVVAIAKLILRNEQFFLLWFRRVDDCISQSSVSTMNPNDNNPLKF